MRYVREPPAPEPVQVDRAALDDLGFWESSGVEIEAYTYFMQAEAGGPVKIGVAKKPLERLALLQTGNPQRLVIRHVLPLNCERFMHAEYEEHRLVGEWFERDERILADAQRCSAWLREDPARIGHESLLGFLGKGNVYTPVDPVDWAKDRTNPDLVAMLWREGWRIDQIARRYTLNEDYVAEIVALLKEVA